MKILFFHCGPGLNSNPEKHILVPAFESAGIRLVCWNEPSALRPGGPTYSPVNAFHNYLSSAENFLLQHYDGQPLCIMGHSFGAQAAHYLAKRHPDKLKHIFFVASDLSLADTDINTFSTIILDYRQLHDERADKLETILNRYTGHFDENAAAGFTLVAENPRYFSYCWHNKARMEEALAYYIAPDYILDIDAYFGVRKSWYDVPLSGSDVPVTGIYGRRDVLASNEKERDILKQCFTNMRYHVLEASAHNPHIEETDRVMQICLNALGR